VKVISLLWMKPGHFWGLVLFVPFSAGALKLMDGCMAHKSCHSSNL